MRATPQRFAALYISRILEFHWNVTRLFQFNSCTNLCPSRISMPTVLDWQKSLVFGLFNCIWQTPFNSSASSQQKKFRATLFFVQFYCTNFLPSIFSQVMCTKIKGVRKLIGIIYVVLQNKVDPRYIGYLRVLYESVAEYDIENCSILTYFENKKILENKKKCARMHH